MAKIYCGFIAFFLFTLFNCQHISQIDRSADLAINTEVDYEASDFGVEVIPAEESILNEPEVLEDPVKMTLPEIYLSQIGVREATGRNDGPEVEMYLRSVNLGKGYSWCSAFVAWSLDEAEIPHKINAWSPTAENKDYLIYKNVFFYDAKPGDVFTIWYPRLKRIGHTGFHHQTLDNGMIVTVEGNTNEAGSREGDGVYKKYRRLKTIHSISRWK